MKGIKFLGLIFFCTIFAFESYSQINANDLKNIIDRKNVIDITLAGQGGFLSANYSRILLVKQKYFLLASAGMGVIPFYAGFSLPHQLTFNIGKKSNFLEVGLGGTYLQGKTDSSGFTETTTSYLLSPIVGWRKNFSNNLVLRIYANPLIDVSGASIYEDMVVVPYLGISFGYSF